MVKSDRGIKRYTFISEKPFWICAIEIYNGNISSHETNDKVILE